MKKWHGEIKNGTSKNAEFAMKRCFASRRRGGRRTK
jgi:hypothetical protein